MSNFLEAEQRLLTAIKQNPNSKLAEAYRLGRKMAMLELAEAKRKEEVEAKSV